MSKEFDEFMNGIQKEDNMNKEDTEKAMDKIMLHKDLKIQSDEIIRLKAELKEKDKRLKEYVNFYEYCKEEEPFVVEKFVDYLKDQRNK